MRSCVNLKLKITKMKDKIKELRYMVLHLQNMGEISIKAESKLLHKLNGIEEQLRIGSVVLQSEQLNKNKRITLPKVEPSKVRKSNEGVD